MRYRIPVLLFTLVMALTLAGNGCATKKYVRKSINERVTPLEGRTQELEETVRRNTQDIKSVDERLTKRIDDVSTRTDTAQKTADAANTAAQNADQHAGQVQKNVDDLRSNLDSYSLVTTVSVNFRLNSSVLSDESKAQLDTLALEAKNHKGFVMEIQGFTDVTGSTAANDQLSQERAESVQRYLAKQHQIPLYKMSILGLGKLTDGGNSRQARAQNRRVDVRLMVNNAVSPNNTAAQPGNPSTPNQ